MPHFVIKYAACKLSSAKFKKGAGYPHILYGCMLLWLCHKPVFYAEHRRPRGHPLGGYLKGCSNPSLICRKAGYKTGWPL
jgi:hypothetical protein